MCMMLSAYDLGSMSLLFADADAFTFVDPVAVVDGVL